MTSDLLTPLAPEQSQAYLSDRLQVADILEWILRQTGPADVRMSSFSISEEFLRRIFYIRKSNLVRSLQVVLDFKATNKTLILWPFIAQTVEHCHLAANHSKILLVSNDTWRVAVIMSQNLTRGNRFESACVSTDSRVFASLDSQFNYLVTYQSVPFNEIYRQTVGEN